MREEEEDFDMNNFGFGTDWASSHYFLLYKLLWVTSIRSERIMLANQGTTVLG